MLAWGVLLSGVVGGCVRERGAGAPSAVLQAYAEALIEGDSARAHALLTPADRAALDRAALDRALGEHPAEARALGSALKRATALRVRAVATLEDGTEVELEQTEHGFRIADPLTRFYAQTTPRATLLSFLRAVERDRWDVVLRLLPDAARARLDAARLRAHFEAHRESMTRTLALLSESRAAPIEIVGERATMPYAERFTARFVRESGAWKLESPE